MKITTIGIIGCGTVARGVAQNVAHAKLDVVMYDEKDEWLDQGLRGMELALDYEISRWGLTQGDKKSILRRITTTTRLADLRKCHIVIEAKGWDIDSIVENFARLEHICSLETIFITNTTTLSISDIQKHLRYPEKVIGAHFILPVPKSVVVEVIRGVKTSNATWTTTEMFMETLGKRSIDVFEYPGFVTARIILPMINTAAQVLMEGLAKADDIDDAIHLGYNLSLGPLAMADQIGVDTVVKYMDSIFQHLGDPNYRACPLLRKMVRDGKHGVKTGQGFYRYDEFRRRIRG